MVVLPLVTVGQTRSTRVRAVAILITLMCLAYAAGRWFAEIRESTGDTGLSFVTSEPQTIFQGSLLLLMMGELVCRRYWRRLGGINWRNPLHIRRVFAPNDIEIEVAQLADN